jgi:hypothetical protein
LKDSDWKFLIETSDWGIPDWGFSDWGISDWGFSDWGISDNKSREVNPEL